MRRLSRSLARVLLALAAAAAWASVAAADDKVASHARDVDWSAHPGAGVLAVVGVAALVALGVAGVGAAAAVLWALFPRVQAAMDRQARGAGVTRPLLVGSLVLVGILGAIAGAAHGGAHVVAKVAAVALGLPAFVLVVGGSMATLPLLGERVLGARGAAASPLRRAVTGSVVLALAALPGVVFHLAPLAFLFALVATGWPLGVGLAAVLGRGSAPAAPPVAAPTPPPA